MALEIEHKYLVKDDSYRTMASRHVNIMQGYLSRDKERTVRVRIAGDRAFLTVKGRSEGDTRLEFEYKIPVEDARQMLDMCTGRIVDKVRYYVDFEGFTWEVDEFHGDLAPLVTAEVELSSSHRGYALPSFVGEDVTGNPRYFNSNL